MVTGRLAMDTEKNRFDKLQQEQRDLDASYRQSLKNKKERTKTLSEMLHEGFEYERKLYVEEDIK